MQNLTEIKAQILATPTTVLANTTIYYFCEKYGVSKKYLKGFFRRNGLIYKKLKPWENTPHGKHAAISRFNDIHGTNYSTITEIYKHSLGSLSLEFDLGVTSTTILRWLKEEGGTPRSRGGDHRSEAYRSMR